MKATMFGLKYTTGKPPVKFMGYYKYKRGEVFQDKNGKPVENKQDTGDIYAVLYRNTDDSGRPHGRYGSPADGGDSACRQGGRDRQMD